MKLQKNENNKDNSKERRTQLRIRETRKLHPNLIT